MAGFIDTFISRVAAALNGRAKRSEDIQALPDRRLLRDVYLPAFGREGGRILWVGCRRYTSGYYKIMESQGAEVWTTELEPRLKRWGRHNRHRTGDICLADELFADMRFDAVICNGVLGYGVDSDAQQVKALEAMARIIKPGGRLLVGWNTDKIADPVAAGLTAPWFAPEPFAGQTARVTFADVTHVYDAFVRRG
ncbi:class I SAM-dependent methyltransferase [Asticcacaulis sp. 201]|uniref:class I SAM-dependent methyltransferase n=1 Tax=Asticcacaulis sp. 201 TaxID=3028787 RepID=UPI002916C066|nr:methyltransferase domain-containing protein [Asticcacaulis sp. 201]MDV6332702.1 methyltransferase domain-containing protein [Asticcacaulis sp. 201]